MLTVAEIRRIIDECRIEAEQGLDNGSQAQIEEITVDFLKPPANFLGLQGNPAIFINTNTYKYLRKYHENWIENRTIAVKIELFDYPKIHIIGILAHETGHAFNIAAGITNSEANAYVFEIEILARWYKMRHPILSDVRQDHLERYFQERLPYYKKSTEDNKYLWELLNKIDLNTLLCPSPKGSISDKSLASQDAIPATPALFKSSRMKYQPPEQHEEEPSQPTSFLPAPS